MILAALASFAALPLLYIGIPHAAKTLMRRQSLARLARSGAIYLTFDDGPDPGSTPKILDLLESHGARATFFAVGENVERHPELARRIVEAGHALGEHSYRHTHALKSAPWTTLIDLMRGAEALAPFRASAGPELFRPPYGKFNLASLALVLASRRRTVFWDIDPRDYACDSPEQAIGRALSGFGPGRVVLLHDGRRAGGSPASVTEGALLAILREGRRRGLRFESIPSGEAAFAVDARTASAPMTAAGASPASGPLPGGERG